MSFSDFNAGVLVIAIWTTDRAVASQWLRARLAPGDAVLFKGSRGVRLEEVAEALESWMATHQASGAGAAAAV